MMTADLCNHELKKQQVLELGGLMVRWMTDHLQIIQGREGGLLQNYSSHSANLKSWCHFLCNGGVTEEIPAVFWLFGCAPKEHQFAETSSSQLNIIVCVQHVGQWH